MSQTLDAKTPITRWQPYLEYKQSGIEWLGEIPSHWEVKRLKQVTALVSRGNSPEYVSESSIQVINQACIYWDGLHLQNVKYQKDEDVSDWKGLLRKNDVLLNSTATGTLGRAAIFNHEGTFIADSHVTVIRLWSEMMDVRFVFYLLRSSIYQGYIYSALISGSTNQIELSRESLRATPISTPPLPEQRAIAAFLDRETARINALIAKKQQLIDLLREKRTALISHAVTKGLDPTAPMKDSGVAWLGEIPQGWEIHSLRRVVDTFVDYRGFTPTKTDFGIPLVTARNIKNGIIDFTLSQEFISEEDYPDRMVRGFPKIGDVLVTTEAPLGETAQIVDERIALAQRIILLKVNKSLITNDYLKHYLSSETGKAELWSRATGSTAVGIKASHLREIFVTIPPLSEQIKIVDILKKETAKIDALISRIEGGIKKLQEYRTALVSAAVTGKIDVRNGNGV